MGTSVSDAPVGRLLDGRYRVGARHARGGMATVYEALDTRLDRVVALKVMHPELAEDHGFVTRFIGEARAAARLSHPNVVAVYDQGEDDGVVYLAMELVRGRTLREVIHERGKLDADEALAVMEPVLAALSAAHAAGLVHRDVKPENVLVGDDGQVKVTDFGLARAVTGTSTLTRGLLLGTVAYVSPEQALGDPTTPRSDVYSAGILLSELLTGVSPHDGATDFVVVRKHIEQGVPPPSEREPRVPAVVDDLVLRAAAREPTDRFADAGAFLVALRHARRTLRTGDTEAAPSGSPRHAVLGIAAVGPLAILARGTSAEGDTTSTTTDQASAGAADHQARTARTARTAAGGSDAGTAVIRRPPDDAQLRPTPPGAHAPASRRRVRPGPVAFVLVLLAAIGTVAAAWWLGVERWTSTPSLLRLDVAAAEARLESAGLSLDVSDDQVFSETVAEGLILATDPEPGERVLKGGTVTATLSAGPERFAVPAVEDLTVEEAEAALVDAELVLGEVTERYDNQVPLGVVIEQGVAEGEQVRRGTPVPLTVSRGREEIEIPSVVGRPADEAERTLEDAGFTVSRTEAFSDEVAQGLVMSQDPSGGTGLRDDPVTIVVSRGADVVEVPDLVELPYEEAASRLEAVGLVPRQIQLFPGPGTVLRQVPEPGQRLPRGSEVTLFTL